MSGQTWLAILMMALSGCGYRVSEADVPPGIYECATPWERFPVYRFDSRARTTLYFVGDGGGLRFVDLETGESVRLREDSQYTCRRIRPYPVPPLSP